MRDETIPNTIAKAVAEQLSRMLNAAKGKAELIGHNLEKGLGNEEALRSLLSWFLPHRFGVAKGKIANAFGGLSKHLDVVIYDALGCPTLFLDENRNQILPVEGVYAAVEVKTTLDASKLRQAFVTLASVNELAKRVDRSTNDHVTCCPPQLKVFAFADDRSLQNIAAQFESLSREFSVERSFSTYAPKSPAHKDVTDRTYLVSRVYVADKGCVLNMLDGTVGVYDWAEYTLGMFLAGFVDDFGEMSLETVRMTDYLNWIMIEKWRGSPTFDRIQA